MTETFCIIIFLSVVIYDIMLLIKKKRFPKNSAFKMVTEVFRHWYMGFPFVPFSVGVIFLGHFINTINVFDSGRLTLTVLLSIGVPLIALSFIMSAYNKMFTKKWVAVLLILAGYLVGDLFW